MQPPIDPLSARFIEWAGQRLNDQEFYRRLVDACQERITTFYMSAPEEIQARLLAKLERGAREHGAASFSAKDIDDELRQEYIDILGWSLIKLFVEEQPAS